MIRSPPARSLARLEEEPGVLVGGNVVPGGGQHDEALHGALEQRLQLPPQLLGAAAGQDGVGRGSHEACTMPEDVIAQRVSCGMACRRRAVAGRCCRHAVAALLKAPGPHALMPSGFRRVTVASHASLHSVCLIPPAPFSFPLPGPGPLPPGPT